MKNWSSLFNSIRKEIAKQISYDGEAQRKSDDSHHSFTGKYLINGRWLWLVALVTHGEIRKSLSRLVRLFAIEIASETQRDGGNLDAWLKLSKKSRNCPRT